MIRDIYFCFKEFLTSLKKKNRGTFKTTDLLMHFGLPALATGLIFGFEKTPIKWSDLVTLGSIFSGFLLTTVTPFFSFIEGRRSEPLPKKESMNELDWGRMIEKRKDQLVLFTAVFNQIILALIACLFGTGLIWFFPHVLPESVAVRGFSVPVCSIGMGGATYLFIFGVVVSLSSLLEIAVLVRSNLDNELPEANH